MIHRVNVELPDVYILVRLYRNFSRPWDEFHQSIQPAISSIQENIDNYRGNIVVLLNDDNQHGFFSPLTPLTQVQFRSFWYNHPSKQPR